MLNSEERIKIKKEYLKTLYQKYEASYKQLGRTLSESDKISIREDIKNIEQEIYVIEAEIKELNLLNPTNENYNKQRAYSQEWESNFPKIDFKESKSIIDDVLEIFEDDEEESEEAIFLIQQSHSMAGDLLIKHIKSSLQNIGNWSSPCEFAFRLYEQANTNNFLDYLAKKYEVQQVSDNYRIYTNHIIEKICNSLTHGSTLFINVDIFSLNDKNNFLEWFVEFWNELVEKVKQRRKGNPLIKLVAVISVGGLVPESCFPKCLCCTKEQFDGKKILELPLQNWEENDINKWLLRHSAIEIKPLQIKQMAENIYATTQGKPTDVYNVLMNELSQKVS
jgi:inactive STAND